MRNLLYILLILPFLGNAQTVVNLSPDSTLWDLHQLPPGAAPAPSYLSTYYSDTVRPAYTVTPPGDIDFFYDTLFYALDTITDGGIATSVLDLSDLMYILASHDSTDSKLNVADTGNFTLVHHNGGTALAFDSLDGWTGSGDSWFDTQWDAETDGVNHVRTSASISVLINHHVASGQQMETGVSNSSRTTFAWTQNAFRGGRVNSGTSSFDNVVKNDILLTINRPDVSTQQVYVDGGVVVDAAIASTSAPMSTFDAYVFAMNTTGSPTDYSTKELSFVMWGGGLTATQIASLDTVLDWFKAAMGF